MQMKSWEYAAVALFLTACLLLGLVLGDWLIPTPAVGVIRFEGTIDFVAAQSLNELIDVADREPSIAAIVLEVLSPGGLATSSENIFYSLLQLRQSKPVVVVVDSLAVSGGFYLAAAGNRIYTQASGFVGNIGTRGPRPLDPAISPEEMSSGPFKLSGGNRFDRIQQLALVRDSFVDNVVHQRAHAEVNPLKVDATTIAEGRVYMGSEALGIGLVDLEGGRSDAIAAAAQLAGVRNYRVVDVAEYLPSEEKPGSEEQSASLEAAVKSLMEQAPPDAVFLLDSRLALPGVLEGSDLDRHLMKLRDVDPASLSPSESRPELRTRVEALTR